jgi:hypothetical protein
MVSNLQCCNHLWLAAQFSTLLEAQAGILLGCISFACKNAIMIFHKDENCEKECFYGFWAIEVLVFGWFRNVC